MAKRTLCQMKSEALEKLSTLESQARTAASTRGGLTTQDQEQIAAARDVVTSSSLARDAEENIKLALGEISTLVGQILNRSERP